MPKTKIKKTKVKASAIAKELKEGFKKGWGAGMKWSWEHLEKEEHPYYTHSNGIPLKYKEYITKKEVDAEAKRLKAQGHPVKVAREFRWFIGGFRTRPDWIWIVYYNPKNKPFGKEWKFGKARVTKPTLKKIPPLIRTDIFQK